MKYPGRVWTCTLSLLLLGKCAAETTFGASASNDRDVGSDDESAPPGVSEGYPPTAVLEMAFPISDFRLKLFHPGAPALDSSGLEGLGALVESTLDEALRQDPNGDGSVHEDSIVQYERIELNVKGTLNVGRRVSTYRNDVRGTSATIRGDERTGAFLRQSEPNNCPCTVATFAGSTYFSPVNNIFIRKDASSVSSRSNAGPLTEVVDGKITEWLKKGNRWYDELFGKLQVGNFSLVVDMELLSDDGDDHRGQVSMSPTAAPYEAEDDSMHGPTDEEEGDNVSAVVSDAAEQNDTSDSRPYVAGALSGAAACFLLIVFIHAIRQHQRKRLIKTLYPEEEIVFTSEEVPSRSGHSSASSAHDTTSGESTSTEKKSEKTETGSMPRTEPSQFSLELDAATDLKTIDTEEAGLEKEVIESTSAKTKPEYERFESSSPSSAKYLPSSYSLDSRESQKCQHGDDGNSFFSGLESVDSLISSTWDPNASGESEVHSASNSSKDNEHTFDQHLTFLGFHEKEGSLSTQDHRSRRRMDSGGSTKRFLLKQGRLFSSQKMRQGSAGDILKKKIANGLLRPKAQDGRKTEEFDEFGFRVL